MASLFPEMEPFNRNPVKAKAGSTNVTDMKERAASRMDANGCVDWKRKGVRFMTGGIYTAVRLSETPRLNLQGAVGGPP